MKYIFSCILATFCVFAQKIDLGLLESEIYDHINPYHSFFEDHSILKENLFGKGIYYYENKRIKTDDVEQIDYSDNVVSIKLTDESDFNARDVVYTFKHYKRYFNTYKNFKYYFFSKITNIRSSGKTIYFELKEKGLFQLHYLTYPILRSISAGSFISKDQFKNGVEYYGYGEFVISQQENDLALKAKELELRGFDEFSIKIYKNVNLLQTDIIGNHLDYYESKYFSKFIEENQFILNNFRKRYLNKLLNNLYILGFNHQRFSEEERNQFAKIINRDKITSTFISFQGKVANSLFQTNSRFFFNRDIENYQPLSAINRLKKLGYKVQEESRVFKKNDQKNALRLYYPANDELFKLIAEEIILNFHEVNMDMEAIPVEKDELLIRINQKRHDLFLIDLNYEDNEYIAFFKFLKNQKIVTTPNIIRFIDRLEIVAEYKNYLPLIQRIQLQIEQYQDFFPLFFMTHEQILINKDIEEYLKSYTYQEQRYFEINPLSKWKLSGE